MNQPKFKLSLSIINHLRSFTIENHEFTEHYIEQLNLMLVDFEIKNSEFINSQKEFNLDAQILIIAIHFYFSTIYNFQQLIENHKEDFKIISSSKSQMNKTNIFNIQILNSSINNHKLKNKVKNYFSCYELKF